MERFRPFLAAATVAVSSSIALAQSPAPPTTEKPKIPAVTEPGPAPTSRPQASTDVPPSNNAAVAPPAETAPGMSPATTDAPAAALKDAAKEQPALTEAPGDIATSKLIGASVYNTQNENIGQIEDLIISSSGSVVTVVIGVGGFLGIGEKKVAMPFSALKAGKGDNNLLKIVVEETRESLKAQPDFKYAANI
ncbi:MAG: PRC-barrel domain-containing protein [Hyphomicrobiaceae bacterium]|nr:PRC-barrel domain-containing protein [Hyphomicrobiaceae bacterium]